MSEWVPAWIELTWGASVKTVKRYRYHWRSLAKWLGDRGIDDATLITREICQSYPAWRQEPGRGKNTAIQELGFLAQVLEEARRRGHIEHNVARNLRISKEPVQHKEAWSDAAILRVGQTLARSYAEDPTNEQTNFLYVSFLLGLFQAARLGHCQLPLECVNLERQLIHYRAEIVKGGKAFSQPIDPRLLATLREIKIKRTLEGKACLCELPRMPSVVWREFLDGLGYETISHHGLRVTWAARACIAGLSLAEAMAYCNHASAIVHRVHQRLSHTDLLPKLSRVALPVFASESAVRALPDTTSGSEAA